MGILKQGSKSMREQLLQMSKIFSLK